MPAGDRTGPVGQGPGTGRGLGYCNGFNRPGFMQPGPGMGRNRNWGRGRGRGRGYWSAPHYGRRFAGYYSPVPAEGQAANYSAEANANPVSEEEALEERYDYLKEEMEAIKKRLDELKNEDK